MLATVDAVGGENVANQAISQHQPIEDGVFAVGHIQIDVFGSSLLQSPCRMGERAATGADIVHNEDVTPLHLFCGGQFQPLNLARAPIPVLDAEDILGGHKLGVPFGGAFVRVAKQEILHTNGGNRSADIPSGLSDIHVVNEGCCNIGMRVEHRNPTEMERIDEVSKPLEGEHLVSLLRSVHSGVGNVRHDELDESILSHHGTDVMHKVPQQDTLMVTVVHPHNGGTLVEPVLGLGVKAERRCSIREPGKLNLLSVYKNHLVSPPSSRCSPGTSA